ncbi:MAG TPA: enoyl-CoA hydratase/isomerase family protein [Puia sp.]|jgi:enoyl-CoA hydratase/carnithine racemase
MDKYLHIELDIQDGVGLLAFDRPEQLNAMNRRMMDEIIDALEGMACDPSIRAGIVTGKGRAFMAGADIKEYAVQTPAQFNSFRENGMRLYRLIEGSSIPFIAAVNGFALGGGFEIALACDFMVAAETASMGLPEIHLGLIPGGGGAYRLMRAIGLNRVKEVLMLGQPYPAGEMHRWGVVHQVVRDGEVLDAAYRLAGKLKRRSLASLAALKKMLAPSAAERSFDERMGKEGQAVLDLFYNEEAQALIRAFMEKNK